MNTLIAILFLIISTGLIFLYFMMIGKKMSEKIRKSDYWYLGFIGSLLVLITGAGFLVTSLNYLL